MAESRSDLPAAARGAPTRPFALRLALAIWVIAEAAAFFGLAYLIGIVYTLMDLHRHQLPRCRPDPVRGEVLPGRPDYLNSGGDPARELPNGYALAGAVCLIVPGFVTDVIGLLLLFPPTRLIFRGLGRWIAARTPTIGSGEPTSSTAKSSTSATRTSLCQVPGTRKNGPRSIDPGP